jgi:16S rRNA G966 N2-methylase RsmD
MQYQFAVERPDYSDLSSGRVFYSLPGHPAFPVRLASEVFQRCLALRKANGLTEPCILYDPCCGAAYHLGILAYLHGEVIQSVSASDVDADVIRAAQRNLSLLRVDGIAGRIVEITALLNQYGKESHREALESARTLQQRIKFLAREHPIQIDVFQADVFERQALKNHFRDRKADIVFSDVPYGLRSRWQASGTIQNPLWTMLDVLLEILTPESLVAIASDKTQKPAHEKYRRLEHFQVGKRRVVILQPAA